MKAGEIATEAAKLVCGDRKNAHGSPALNHANIAALWNGYLGIRREPASPLSGEDVALMMALLKVARTQSGALNVDDFVDGSGYMAIAGELAQQD